MVNVSMVSVSMVRVGMLSVSSVSIAQRMYAYLQYVSMVTAGTFGVLTSARHKTIRAGTLVGQEGGKDYLVTRAQVSIHRTEKAIDRTKLTYI